MELVRAPTLEECWNSLSTVEKTAINSQLTQIVGKLRSLSQDPSERFLGMIENAS